MIACIIQARMGSSRLPGKTMMKIDDQKTTIFYVIDQLRHSQLLDKIVVATTNLQEDDLIFNYVTKMGIDCFRGNENDVLDRHYQCALKYNFSEIVTSKYFQ